MFNILVVDDSKSVHAFIKSLKLPSELVIHSVFDGSQGLSKLNSNPKFFDLVLLDWEMPVLNGPETLKKLIELNNTVPIVMMTTKNNPEDIALALSLGATEYIMKPFDLEILIEKINSVTGWEMKNVS